METKTTIEWAIITSSKGRKGNNAEIRMAYHTSRGSKKNPYCSLDFPMSIVGKEINFERVRFGKLSNKIVFKFNNENGVRLSKQITDNGKKMKAYGKELCEFILVNTSTPLLEGKYNLKFAAIAENTYIIEAIKYDV